MPFAYYKRLSRRDQAIYRKSDALHAPKLKEITKYAPEVNRLRDALARDDRVRVERACRSLVRHVCADLAIAPPVVRVHDERPSSEEEELHGLYTLSGEDEPAQIEVWMRTAARRQVVAFKTFLRTLLHEVCHHLDYHHFALADSFHTEGFYRRESVLAKQLIALLPAFVSDGPVQLAFEFASPRDR